MKRLLIAIALLLAAGVGYFAGYVQARSDARQVGLAHALEKTAICANVLMAARVPGRHAGKMLDEQLRRGADEAEARLEKISILEAPMPSLVEGVRRAEVYARGIRDEKLAAQLTRIREKLTKLPVRRK